MTDPLDPNTVAGSAATAPPEGGASGVVAAPPAGLSPDPSPGGTSAPELKPSLLETFDRERAADPETPAPAPAPAPELELAAPVEVEAAPIAAEPAPAPPPLAPISYDYALPEGFALPEAEKARVAEAFDAFRADPATGAQALVNLYAEKAAAFVEAQRIKQFDVFNDTRQGWVSEVMADPQLGGSGHRTAMGAIARTRDQFVPDERRAAFENMLRVTGVGDHPEFLRFVLNVSRAFDEPAMPPPNAKPTPSNGMQQRRGMRSLYNNNA